MQELGLAINDALSNSSGVNDAIDAVREAGYDVFLVLEATIGVHRRAESGEPADSGEATHIRLKINDQDVNFLKSLKIRVDDPDNH